MSTTIKIKCIDQTLTYEGTPTVASGGVNEDYVQFEFCPLWDGFSKVAVFYQNKGEIYYNIVSTNNVAVIPKEVIATKGIMYLGVLGVKDNVTKTSLVLPYRIENGALDGFTPEEPTQELYQQVLNLSNEMVQKVNEIHFNNAGAHNAIYRGKALGSTVTTAQYNAIKNGTFEDLYIGDYWTINGVNWRIAGFDYYLNSGDTLCTTHHAVIVPDTCLYNAQMNSSNTSTGGYAGSDMYTKNLETAKTTIKNAFSGHVLKHRIYLTNAVANGRASAGAWFDSEVDLMCEQMVYGSGIFSPVSDGSNIPINYKVEKSQLPLFQHEPSRIYNRNNWWFRDVIADSYFARVHDLGLAYCSLASFFYGVRPSFCIS